MQAHLEQDHVHDYVWDIGKDCSRALNSWAVLRDKNYEKIASNRLDPTSSFHQVPSKERRSGATPNNSLKDVSFGECLAASTRQFAYERIDAAILAYPIGL